MKKTMTALAVGLSLSSVAIGAEDHSQHKGMNHSGMTMDCSDPMHAQMDQCKEMQKSMEKMDHSGMDHSQHQGMNQGEMDHSMHQGMEQGGMDHSQHQMPMIPVSDGSASEDIPVPFPGAMHMEDDPLLTKVIIDQLEVRDSDEEDNPVVLEAEAWIGKDLKKLWLKTEVEQVGDETEEAELQILYSKAVAPYWDFQAGVRMDFEPEGREWLAVGFKGLAPYFFETDAAVFIGDEGRTAARLSAEYEMMLTQKTVLSPEFEINLYGKDDPEIGIGSGLSDASVGLRLRHEFKREFAPYIGVNWSKSFGQTADFAKDEGEDTSDTVFVAGIRAWF